MGRLGQAGHGLPQEQKGLRCRRLCPTLRKSRAGPSFTAEVEQWKPKGVVLSHGGVNFGYALYFNKGKPAFCMRNKGELTELVAKKKVQGRVEPVGGP